MILDTQLVFSENQAITATALSENILRLQETGIVYGEGAQITRNLGAGNEVPLMIQATEDFNNLTSLTITVETSDNEDMTSSTVLVSTGAIALADLKAGWQSPVRWLPDAPLKDYLAIRYTVTGTAPTAGRVSAALATEVGSR